MPTIQLTVLPAFLHSQLWPCSRIWAGEYENCSAQPTSGKDFWSRERERTRGREEKTFYLRTPTPCFYGGRKIFIALKWKRHKHLCVGRCSSFMAPAPHSISSILLCADPKFSAKTHYTDNILPRNVLCELLKPFSLYTFWILNTAFPTLFHIFNNLFAPQCFQWHTRLHLRTSRAMQTPLLFCYSVSRERISTERNRRLQMSSRLTGKSFGDIHKARIFYRIRFAIGMRNRWNF